MTSPRHAEATALGRYYAHPTSGQQLISVTNALSVGCAKPALVPWAAKIVAEEAIDQLPILTHRLRTEDPETVRKDLSKSVTVARDKAADMGSRVHALAEAHVLGVELPHEDGDEDCAPFTEQLLRFFTDFDVDLQRDVEATELTVAYPSLGYAGTLDLLVRLPLDGHIPGSTTKRVDDPAKRGLFLVDYKSSLTRAATSVYGEYALQLTALRKAREAWMPDGEIVPVPKGIVGTAVLNLRRRTYELIPLPSGDAEWTAFQGCLAIAKWMHGTGNDISRGDHRPITPQGKAKPKRTRKTTTPKTTTTTKAA